jgi:cytochrome c2
MKEIQMSFRPRISLLLAVLLSLILVVPAYAGGWAVITLDTLPSGAVAGEPLSIGFTVRQHGRTPMDGLTPKITAMLGGEKVVFFAEPEGEVGHYTAILTLPKDGEWEWAIEAFTMYQPMPVLTVALAGMTATNPPAKNTAPASLLTSSIVPVSMVLFALGLLGAFIAFRRKSRLMMVVTLLCLVAGIAMPVVGAGTASEVEAQTRAGLSTDSAVSQVELGRQLFLAKGCITCHANSKAAHSSDYMTIGMGAPDLSKFSASPEALRMRLKDPSSMKSDTAMPDLNLHEAEIEALIAFINSKSVDQEITR